MKRTASATTLLIVLAAASFGQARATFEARLAGTTVAKGKAKFQTRLPQAELQVEAENLIAGTAYRVTVGSMSWVAVADAFRKIRVERRWLAGAPNFGVGTPVRVATTTNVLVLTGTMVRVR